MKRWLPANDFPFIIAMQTHGQILRLRGNSCLVLYPLLFILKISLNSSAVQ